MFTSLLSSLLLPALVSAHGYVNKISIDGKVYQGNSVGTTPTISSVIRQVNSNGPVKGASNSDLSCGPGAQPAADIANANPGSTVQVYWVGGTTGTSPWPHNTGPLMHYMAKCDGPCTSYNSANAEWFKISEQGLESDGKTWYQSELQSGTPATVTIPSNLAAGNYLLRSEIITLQLAMTEGGAEFYPSCSQISVGGSQSAQPSSSDEVTFPGGYTDTEPGILTPNIYNPPINYTFPGPPIASFISGGSSSGSSTGSGSVLAVPSSAPSSISSVPAAPSSPTEPSSVTTSSGPAEPPSTAVPSSLDDPCSDGPSPTISSPVGPSPIMPATSPAEPSSTAVPSSPDDPCSEPSPSGSSELSSPVVPSGPVEPSSTVVPSSPDDPCYEPSSGPAEPSSTATPSGPAEPSSPVATSPVGQSPPPSPPIAPSASAPLSPSMVPSPKDLGANPPFPTTSTVPTPTPTEGSDSGCMEDQPPVARAFGAGKRMHRRRYRPSH